MNDLSPFDAQEARRAAGPTGNEEEEATRTEGPTRTAAESPGRTLRTPAELAAAGIADPRKLAALEAVAARYAVAITPAMTELIDAADPADPIARQFVPDPRE